jgi:hypothetical protein
VEITCKLVFHQKGCSLKSGCLGKHEVGMRNTVLDLRKKKAGLVQDYATTAKGEEHAQQVVKCFQKTACLLREHTTFSFSWGFEDQNQHLRMLCVHLASVVYGHNCQANDHHF